MTVDPDRAPVAFTVGHSNQSLDALIGLLRANGVELVCDVRRFPRSRRHPQFNIETLQADLARAGIGYRHIEALGGRRPKTLADHLSPNTGWDAEGFRNYADYALTPAFHAALDDLLGLVRLQPVAVLCAELLWWQCHRRIITDYLLVRGIDVRHVLGLSETKPAEITAGASAQADGSIHYPPAQPRLL